MDIPFHMLARARTFIDHGHINIFYLIYHYAKEQSYFLDHYSLLVEWLDDHLLSI